MTRSLSLLFFTVLVASFGCAKPYDPFQIPREEFRNSVHRVALVPKPVPYQQMDAGEGEALLEPKATARLVDAGFEVVPSSVWTSLWRQSANDVGGVFNPSTAEADEEKINLVRESVFDSLERDHNVDAVLYFNVRTVELDKVWDPVSFCGAKHRAYFPTASGKAHRGSVNYAQATCLYAVLSDMEQRILYSIRHGIEVFDTRTKQTRAVMPRELRLRDTEKIEEAIEVTLGPLTDLSKANRQDD